MEYEFTQGIRNALCARAVYNTSPIIDLELYDIYVKAVRSLSDEDCPAFLQACATVDCIKFFAAKWVKQ